MSTWVFARGSEIIFEKLPDGRIAMGPKKPTGDICSFIGMLKDKTNVRLSIEEMNQVIADSWAGKLDRK